MGGGAQGLYTLSIQEKESGSGDLEYSQYTSPCR